MVDVLIDGTRAARTRLAKLASRQRGGGAVERQVASIIAAVRREGDAALLRYTKRFDGVTLTRRELRVGNNEIDKAMAEVPVATLRALKRAHARIVKFHRHQVERGYDQREPGIRVGVRVVPLERVGVYVPGGRAAYPSSVLMNVVPAKVAGVSDITVVTPPSPQGVSPEVLAAARIAGADRIVRVGGAQAVAALAYGTASIARVDKVVGPGNVFVATAKRLVFGAVGIDMIAGPTEVLVIADGSARASFVAADMLAQAEHDPQAAAVCISTSRGLAESVSVELASQLAELPRRSVAARSLGRYGTIVVVDSLDRALELANDIAPEHLELFVRNPRRLLPSIRNAGAVFVGEYSTEPVGDYAAGPNHVLPTGGSARFSSPLGVYDFVKRMSIIETTRSGLERLAPTVERLAASEGLDGHALAVSRRLAKEGA